ncbi:Ig-like domain-containing protein, partial [Neobacillus cucumis]|uniref:Ig-like domain-containing protein n=1 Tax=Neobacillus cucumis TaxID=1740721 RepID=UPI00203ED450
SYSDYENKLGSGQFTVSGTTADVTNPVLDSIQVDKTEVKAGESVKISVKATDNVGVSRVYVYYKSPITNKTIGIYPNYNSLTNSYEGSYTITSNSEAGTYKISSVYVYDTSDNVTYLPSYSDYENKLRSGQFTAITENNPPIFSALSIDKSTVESGDNLNIYVDASDDTNLQSATINYISPISQSKRSVTLSYNGQRFVGQMAIDSNTEAGKWKVDSIEIKDTNNNSTVVKSDAVDLSAGTFSVLKPITPLNSYIVSTNETWSNKTISNNVYIKPGVTLTISSNVTIYGNIYVLGGLRSYGGLNLVGSLYANSVYFGYYTPSNGQAIFTGTNYISSMYVSGRVLTDVPLTLYGTPLVSNNGKLNLTGATLPFVSVAINGQAIALRNDGTFRLNDFYVGSSDTLSVKITDLFGYSYYYSYKVIPDLTIDEITKYTQTISGITVPNSTIKILENNSVIGTGTSNGQGYFYIQGNNLIENSTLTFEVYNTNNELIASKQVKVKDLTPPANPTLNDVTDNDQAVTGVAEAGSKVDIKVNGLVIGSGTAGTDGNFSIAIPVQKAGAQLIVTATDSSGNVSNSTTITVKDVTPPSKPTVDEVTDKDTVITGLAEAGSTVQIKVNGVLIGSATTGSDGKFSAAVSVQKAGTELVITATDHAGNISEAITYDVKDGTSPAKPDVNEVTDKDTSVSGQTESGAKVDIMLNDTLVGSNTVEADGKFTIIIPVQKAGTQLVVTATDNAGNVSETATIVVKDVTSPVKPVVNEVTDQANVVTGEAEVASKVEVKVNGAVIGSGTTGPDGEFSVSIAVQKAGTQLAIIATDGSGNVSETTTKVVKDITAPVKPVVNDVSEKSNTVTGQAEAGSNVEIKVSSSIIGSANVGADGKFSITIPVQKAGTKLLITATDSSGNVSETAIVEVKDVTSPAKPVVNEVTDKSTAVTGQAEIGSSVKIKVNDSVIGTGTTGSDGKFSLSIPVQKAGTQLVVTATDQAGNVSEATPVVVKDVTSPAKPVVNEVTDKSTAITGKAEAGSKVEVKLNGTAIGSGTSGIDGIFSIGIPVQKAGTQLVITSTDQAGNVGEATTVVVKDITSPVKPIVNEVTDKSTAVTGQAEPGSKVEIKLNGTLIGSGTAGIDGKFSITIPVQKAGIQLTVTSIDPTGNVSDVTSVVVKDVTSPAKPVVNEVTDKTTSVSGQAEAGSKVEVKVSGSVIGSETAGMDGKFSIKIPVQKAGTQLVVTATDPAGNASETTTVEVKDVTTPAKPVVNEVTDKSTAATGQAEIGSKVEIKVNGSVIGSGITGTDGQFSVTIPIQKAGTQLVVTVTDKAGNISEATTVVVKDLTSPAKPVVNQVTDKSTTATGQAEIGSKVEIKVNGSVIGSGITKADGKFSVIIPVQKAGTKLVVIATDQAGNVSESVTVVVKDVTSPAKPVVNEVTDRATNVTGHAEAGSTVEVKVNGTAIGSSTAGADGKFSIIIPMQKVGTILQVTAKDTDGNISEPTTVTIVDRTAPSAPTVNPVSDKLKEITGKTEAGALITAMIGNMKFSSKADNLGNFKIIIPLQKAGTKIIVTAVDTAGNISPAVTLTVLDKTTPMAPTVNPITDQTKIVTGKTEASATVTIMIGIKKYQAKVDNLGNFKIAIPLQKAGTKVIVTAVDTAGNISPAVTLTVLDKTAPMVPTVNLITDQTKMVTGKTEASATVTIMIGIKKYQAKADNLGNFKILIPLQRAGTKVSVTAKDAVGNVSAAKIMSVMDKTPPAKPKVNIVKSTTITITGTAEAYSTITIKVGSTIIGTGKADKYGRFSVKVKAQRKNTIVSVYSTDAAKNVSAATSVKVQ